MLRCDTYSRFPAASTSWLFRPALPSTTCIATPVHLCVAHAGQQARDRLYRCYMAKVIIRNHSLGLGASALLAMAALAQREFSQTKYWRTRNRPWTGWWAKDSATGSCQPAALPWVTPGGPQRRPMSRRSESATHLGAQRPTEPRRSMYSRSDLDADMS